MKKSLLSLIAIVGLAVVCGAAFAGHMPDLLQLMPPDIVSNIPGIGLAMTTLAVNTPRAYELGDNGEYPVIASDIIYEGAAVGENASGYARPLVAGDPFLGFATAKADNSAGAAGAVNVEVKRRGQVQLAVAGATAITANDRPLVYAADDNSFTLTASTNTIIGRVSRWISSGVCVVEFDALVAPSL